MLDEGVTVIEWGDAVCPALPADYLEVRLAFGDDDDERDPRRRAAVGHGWTPRAAVRSTPALPRPWPEER